MTPVEETTRQLVDAWLAGFTWTTAPNVSVRAQTPPGATSPATEEDDSAPDLPTMAFVLSEPSDALLLQHPKTRDDSPTDQIVYEMGRAEAPAEFVFKCRSEAEANTFKREFRSNAWLSMLADGETKMPVVKKLDGQFLDGALGVADHIRVMLEPIGFITHPMTSDTGLEDRWILRHAALVSYPLLEIEPAPGTGRMDVLINHLRCQ